MERRRIRMNAAVALLGRDAGEVAGSDAAKYPVASEREILALYPLVNRRDDSPRNRFSVTSEDVMAAEKAARREWCGRRWLVSFASRPSGAAERVRSRSCVAVVQLHHRQRAERGAAGDDLLAIE